MRLLRFNLSAEGPQGDLVRIAGGGGVRGLDLVVKNGTVVTATEMFRADVGLAGGRVACLGEFDYPPDTPTIDAAGRLVMPGIVDAHVHLEDVGDGGVRTADDFTSGTRAAAAGGTTTVIDFVSPARDQSPSEAVAIRRRQAEGRVIVDYALHCCIPEAARFTAEEAARLLAEGISSIKLFTVYAGLALDTLSLYQIMLRAAEAGLTVSLHAETGEIVEHYRQEFAAAGKKEPQYHAWSRPWFAELEAVQRALALNAAAGARLYFVHVTTGAALEAIARARRDGQDVWAETCPHYLLFNESALRGRDGGKYIMSPPLRRPEDSAALWSGLARGEIQVVATDHCPFPLSAKVGRPFNEVPNGVGSIELLFGLLLSEGVLAPDRPRLTPTRLVAAVSTNPARFFGLYPRKGHLAPGADADLIIVDPLKTRTVRAADLHGGEDHSIYEGFTLRGAVETTIARGEVVYDRGRVLGSPGRGRYLGRPVAGWDRAAGGAPV